LTPGMKPNFTSKMWMQSRRAVRRQRSRIE
jgi:hypothetical protein